MSEPLLSVTRLAAGYAQLPVLFDISVDVAEGEVVAILGSNGAGKTTLINNICGLYSPTSGGIRFAGEDVAGLPSQELVERGLVQTPEGRRVFPNLSVSENLMLGCYRRANKRMRVNMERVVALFPKLGVRMRQAAGTLSGGEQQMLAIGRALMAEPRLLILDEPSLGLAPILVSELFGLLRSLKQQGLTLILVEQNLHQSLELADRGYVIEHGEIKIAGAAADLLANPDIRRAYLGL